MNEDKHPIVGVTAVVKNWRGHILLGLKARACDPSLVGKWVTPGGRVNHGETLQNAIVREVREETGLNARTRFSPGVHEYFIADKHFVFIVFDMDSIAGQPIAGDDLSNVGWFKPSEISNLDLTPLTARILSQAGISIPSVSSC